MTERGQIRPHMPVVGSDGGHVGTADRIEHGEIRLTREDDPARNHDHRHLPLRLVSVAEAGQVRLTVTAQEALAVAFGAVRPGDDGDAAGPSAGQVSTRAGVGVSDMENQDGSGMVHGGAGLGDERTHGGGTSGGGGTTRHGHLGNGPGIPNDPNMDPSAAKGPGT